jgi:hypothetical protein
MRNRRRSLLQGFKRDVNMENMRQYVFLFHEKMKIYSTNIHSIFTSKI